MNGTAKAASGTQLLDKALDMVDLVEQSGQRLTANAIARASGHSKPTVNRILAALVRRGFLAIDRRDQSYELGVRFTQLAAALRRSQHLVTLVEEHLVNLSARSGETVLLGVPETAAVRVVGRYHMGLETVPGGPSGAKRPYHASAIGKAILSAMPEKQASRHVGRTGLERFTANTILDRDRLFADLQVARARGYALDDEEIVAGVRCVAVPIFAADGTALAAMSLSAPSHRMTAPRIEGAVAALKDIAEMARKRLPTAPDAPPRTGDMACLRNCGLFHPIAMAASAEQIRVIDGASPAILVFSADGALLAKTALPRLPDAAAVTAQGETLLAHGEQIEHGPAGQTPRIIALDAPVAALAFGQDGRGYALTRMGTVHDALSGKRLFETGMAGMAMTGAGSLLCVTDGAGLSWHDPSNGKQVRHIGLEGANIAAITANSHHVWLAGQGRLIQIGLDGRQVRQVETPEQQITALALTGGDLLLAGANFAVALSDFGAADDNAGGLYRWRTVPADPAMDV